MIGIYLCRKAFADTEWWIPIALLRKSGDDVLINTPTPYGDSL